ncbi:MAG: MraY family glycosyltransferase [Candidatus Cloacimonadota bacterium]|nr:MraY family glycosyltransferase [Candidatus Cloacimonadota bacterium]
MNHLIISFISFFFVYFLTFLIKKIAIKLNFIDKPEERKFHTKPTALMGGIAIFFGLLFGLLVAFFVCKQLLPPNHQIEFYLIGAFLISLLGLIDDRFGMNPYLKFFLQTIIALIFIFGQGYQSLIFSPYITIPLLAAWIVGLMNALNFLDNMDGITSGMATILGLGFFALGILSGNHFLSLLAGIFMASTFGFLFHNFHPAKIFLGDAGSMLIGYTLAVFGITLVDEIINTNGLINFSILLPILLLSYAIFDISLVSITRHRDGRYVLEGGKDHSTHRIGTATGSVKVTAGMVYLINILLVLASVIVFRANNQYLTLIITVIFSLSFLFFGDKLDKIPIVISQNQLKKKPF